VRKHIQAELRKKTGQYHNIGQKHTYADFKDPEDSGNDSEDPQDDTEDSGGDNDSQGGRISTAGEGEDKSEGEGENQNKNGTKDGLLQGLKVRVQNDNMDDGEHKNNGKDKNADGDAESIETAFPVPSIDGGRAMLLKVEQPQALSTTEQPDKPAAEPSAQNICRQLFFFQTFRTISETHL
jgi:hypothetical protein